METATLHEQTLLDRTPGPQQYEDISEFSYCVLGGTSRIRDETPQVGDAAAEVGEDMPKVGDETPSDMSG